MKNFLGFLVTTVLLFNYFSSSSFAAGIDTTSTIDYTFTQDNVFKTNFNINFKNNAKSQTVLNYYTIFLPFDGMSDISVISNDKKLTTTVYKQKDGTELIINFKNYVLSSKKSVSFDISFNSISKVDTNWGYAKLLSKIDGLKINKVTFNYPNNKPDISFADGASLKKITSGNFEFTAIKKPSITVNFGNPITFEYRINKNYINDSDVPTIHEITLPQTNNSQQLILSSISPSFTTSRIDNDNNIILGFLIEPKAQQVIEINGYIIKKEFNYQSKYNTWDINTLGYWNITNQFEKLRLSEYLKATKQVITPLSLSNYVVNRLKLQEGSSVNSNISFENVLRAGADVAIERRNSAIPEDYVDLLIALLRENSIPSRMVLGYISKSSPFSSDGGFHSWVEYYDLTQKKWFALDPSISEIFQIDQTSEFDTNNYIGLLIRSENSNSPKLPFLKNSDLLITPVSTSISPTFLIEKNRNEIKNSGNVPVYYMNSDTKKIIFPNQSEKIELSGKVVFNTLYGETKEIDIEMSEIVSQSSTNLISETILFLSFVLLLIFLNIIYVKLK